MKLGKVGLVGRFKPLHNGAAAMLESVCEKAEHVMIGIGSTNKYNLRNPFTPEESEGMIRSLLEKKFSNYEFLHIPDFAHIPDYADGKKWKSVILERFGVLDKFVTSNEYIANLLKDTYEIVLPVYLIPKEKQVKLKATEVRLEIAKDGAWEKFVPAEVADYLKKNGIIGRFQKEFGLATLAQLSNGRQYNKSESATEEKLHSWEE